MEVYSIIGAICVVVLGWFVQLVGLSWEPVALGLAILGAGFTPRIMRSIKSRQVSKVEPQAVRLFQTFLGGDDLLKELERVDAACARLAGSFPVSWQDIRSAVMELDHLWIELTQLRGRYRGVWTPSLRNRVTMIIGQLHGASSDLNIKDLEDTRAHLDGAVQNTQAFIHELKNPPQVNNEKKSG